MPINPNMVAIQTVTVGSGGTSSIQFTSIPQTYTDLVIYISGRSNRSEVVDTIKMTFNGNTSNYSNRGVAGNGSGAFSFNNVGSAAIEDNGALTADTATASVFGNAEIYIANYTSSNNKAVLTNGVSENNATTAYQFVTAGLWSNSSAITSVTLAPLVGTLFQQYTTATLYGVTSSAVGAKATGGAIYNDADYFYHVFSSSGTFTPTQSISADILVVAGGGGGYPDSGTGGAGAGGLLGFSAQSLSATNYTVTVGAGGGTGSNGSNSQFGGLTACVGGGASNARGSAGSSGGSGGGGSSTSSGGGATIAGGSGTAGQGNAGGSGQHTSGVGEPGGGGGGAGAAGENGVAGSSTLNGDGGIGVSTYSSWGVATGVGENSSGTYYLAGGGPGFYSNAGGLGGGGTSSTGRTGTRNGLLGTGGGGGSGQAGGGAAGTGGSGVVIVRYAK